MKIETRNYWDGLREGIRKYAWWKDGIEYVGNCGTTLKQALLEVDNVEREEKIFFLSQLEKAEKALKEISEVREKINPLTPITVATEAFMSCHRISSQYFREK